MSEVVRVSVIIPTLNRPAQLERCLASITGGGERPAEILVVDQGPHRRDAERIAALERLGARLIACDGRGAGLARNLGVGAASHELIVMTDDDCTVDGDWLGAARRHLSSEPSVLFTGRVIPAAPGVPSTITDTMPREYTGQLNPGALYSGNMAATKSALLELGGFDPRIVPAAEDCDFCYRWLRAGRRMRYVPDMVVWHHDWRSDEELNELYVEYARGQGIFYGKHLRRGELRLLRLVARDTLRALASAARDARSRSPRPAEPGRGIPRGMPRGILEGWRLAKGDR